MKLKLPVNVRGAASEKTVVAVAQNKAGGKPAGKPIAGKPAPKTAAKPAGKAGAKPATKVAAAPAKKSAQTANNNKTKSGKNITMVKVQAGDSLWKVANKYGMTVNELIAINKNIDAKKALKAGTLLAVVDDN